MTPAIGPWLRERFPARNAVFFVVFYVTALLVSRSAATTGAVWLGWRDLPGFAALWSFFLTLRIADEHKDFAVDAVAHPGRVLQRGLVTLGQLRVLGAVALAIQVAVSLLEDGGAVGPVTRTWLVVMAWSALMTREFFAREWLRRRLLVYATSHMLVMPLAALWVATMAAPRAAGSVTVWAFAALSFLAGLAFEIARKMRAPELEHPLADSYTQTLGIPAASVLLFTVVVAASGAALVLTTLLVGAAALGTMGVLGAAVILAGWALAGFLRRPTSAAAKRSEAAVGIAALATHLVPLAALLMARGVAR
jgi:4-hydroxybenzoate polyprenyltransferase